jgi:hypothetical protein
MTAQETTSLPHRLARSANDLAWASLSGVACELKDPRMAKQTGSSSQATQQHDRSQSGQVSTSRPALYSRENSFRNVPNASASRAVEEEFVRFQEKDLNRKDWLSSDLTACVKTIPESGRYQEGSYGSHNEQHVSHHLTSGATANDRANDLIDTTTSRSDTSVVNDVKSNSKSSHARAAAARRLEQIGAQIQRNLAMQMLHQDASSPDYLPPTTTAMDQQYEPAQQTAHQQSRTLQYSHTNSKSESYRVSQRNHHHHHQTPASSLPEDEQQDEQDESQLHFHCPYYACHQNLQRFATKSSGSSRKPCVHAGCNERMETQTAWNEHIALPHHDLQG